MKLPVGRRPIALALLATLAVGAAGVHLLGSSAARPMDRVPADVDYVGHLDLERMYADEAVADTTLAAFRFQSRVVFYDGPRFRSSLAVGESPLDRSRARSVTYFGRADDSAYAARIVTATWTESRVVAAVEATENVTLSPTTIGDRTGYVADDGSVGVAVLGPERYAVGTPAAVRDVVAVVGGGAPAVGDPLRREIERQRPSYARFAFRFDSTTVPAGRLGAPVARRVRTVAAGYYVNGSAVDRMGVRTSILTESPDTARSVHGALVLGERDYRRRIEGANATATYDREMAKVTFDSTGERALVRYETTPTGMRELLAVLGRL